MYSSFLQILFVKISGESCLFYFLFISCPSITPAFFCSVPKYRVTRKAQGMNMPTTIARVAVPLSANSSVGSWDTTLLGSAAKEASGEHTAAAVASAAAGMAAGKPDCALICTVCFIATVVGREGRGQCKGQCKGEDEG